MDNSTVWVCAVAMTDIEGECTHKGILEALQRVENL